MGLSEHVFRLPPTVQWRVMRVLLLWCEPSRISTSVASGQRGLKRPLHRPLPLTWALVLSPISAPLESFPHTVRGIWGPWLWSWGRASLGRDGGAGHGGLNASLSPLKAFECLEFSELNGLRNGNSFRWQQPGRPAGCCARALGSRPACRPRRLSDLPWPGRC